MYRDDITHYYTKCRDHLQNNIDMYSTVDSKDAIFLKQFDQGIHNCDMFIIP